MEQGNDFAVVTTRAKLFLADRVGHRLESEGAVKREGFVRPSSIRHKPAHPAFGYASGIGGELLGAERAIRLASDEVRKNGERIAHDAAGVASCLSRR